MNSQPEYKRFRGTVEECHKHVAYFPITDSARDAYILALTDPKYGWKELFTA